TSVDNLSENGLVTSYVLYDNYPNPFNPSTIIRFNVPQNGWVNLKIFNLLGQEVAELIHNEVSAGIHEVTFNASDLSSGVYFYSLITNQNILTKKMTLLI